MDSNVGSSISLFSPPFSQSPLLSQRAFSSFLLDPLSWQFCPSPEQKGEKRGGEIVPSHGSGLGPTRRHTHPKRRKEKEEANKDFHSSLSLFLAEGQIPLTSIS